MALQKCLSGNNAHNFPLARKPGKTAEISNLNSIRSILKSFSAGQSMTGWSRKRRELQLGVSRDRNRTLLLACDRQTVLNVRGRRFVQSHSKFFLKGPPLFPDVFYGVFPRRTCETFHPSCQLNSTCPSSCRKEQWGQSVCQVWSVLLTQTRLESREHAALGDTCCNTLTQRLTHSTEDTHRLHKRVRVIKA